MVHTVSKYLVQFVPVAKPQTSETSVRIKGARIQTGDKCVIGLLLNESLCWQLIILTEAEFEYTTI